MRRTHSIEDLGGGTVDRKIRRVELEVRRLRLFVRVVDARELLEKPRASTKVEALGIPTLAHVERGRDVHLHESLAEAPGISARRTIRRDQCDDRRNAVMRESTRQKGYSSSVSFSLLT
jgi:hypothetical protein